MPYFPAPVTHVRYRLPPALARDYPPPCCHPQRVAGTRPAWHRASGQQRFSVCGKAWVVRRGKHHSGQKSRENIATSRCRVKEDRLAAITFPPAGLAFNGLLMVLSGSARQPDHDPVSNCPGAGDLRDRVSVPAMTGGGRRRRQQPVSLAISGAVCVRRRQAAQPYDNAGRPVPGHPGRR